MDTKERLGLSPVPVDDDGVDGSGADNRFLSILPYGLKPQFDTTHWVPHGSIHHPTVPATARTTVSGTGAGAGGALPAASNGMSFIDDKSKLAAAAAGPLKPKGAIVIIKDFEVNSLTAELTTTGDTRKTYVSFPENAEVITKLPLLIVQLKNLNKKVTVEVDVVCADNPKLVRTFGFSNAISLVRLLSANAAIPMRLVSGWNKLVFDLKSLCSRVFQSEYRHTCRIRVFAHCRLRRLYFADRVYTEAQLPQTLKTVTAPNANSTTTAGVNANANATTKSAAAAVDS